MSEPPKRSWIARLRARLHQAWRALVAEHSAPSRLAAAAFVGVIAGCTPLFGLHLPLCIALAWLLRLNKVTVYAAANVSVPPMIPIIGFLSVQTGERLLHARWLSLSLADFRAAPAQMAARFAVDWLLGGLLVGAAGGAVLAAIVYVVARGRQRALATPEGLAIAEASRRYRAAPRRLRMYAYFKYRLDPCYRAIAARLAPGSFTVDLGTGLGMLPVVLALLPGGRRALGVDWDARKLAAGRAAADGLDGVELVEGDLRHHPLPACDAITLVDVLHYYPAEEQRALLERCAQALKPGGLLLVRDADARAARGGWTRAVESAAVKLGWNRGGRPSWRGASELADELTALGFTVDRADVAGKLHPGNVLLSAIRAA